MFVLSFAFVAQTFNSLAHATSGSIASAVAMTLFYPLDQLRMVLQADESKEKKSELRVARELLAREGVAGFYKVCVRRVGCWCVWCVDDAHRLRVHTRNRA